MKVVDENLLKDAHRIFMIGIGGVGMSALARVLSHQGFEVTGSDAKETATTQKLIEEGIEVQIGRNRNEFNGEDCVIYSSAIKTDHSQLAAARSAGARVLHRAEVLASLLNLAKTSVGITGTHGKTTTASMISYVLTQLEKDPTCLVGGEVLNLKTNTVLGASDFWISEVDESDRSHELFAPNYTVITNLEQDHVDQYEDKDAVKASFEKFFANVKNPGVLIYNGDDKELGELVTSSGKPAVSFGCDLDNDFSAQNIEFDGLQACFDLYEVGFFAGRVKLNIPGKHNVSNALGTIALLEQLGFDLESIVTYLQGFQGTRRRLQVLYRDERKMVVDDYAHHPTEVNAAIKALESFNQKITVIFQPHRYSRTKHFDKGFAAALSAADQIILTDIYSAGEENAFDVDAYSIVREIEKLNKKSEFRVVPREELLAFLNQNKSDGIIAFLGAGDIGEIAHGFVDGLKNVTSA